MDSLDNTFTAYNKDTKTMYLLNPTEYSTRYENMIKYSTVMSIYDSSNKKLFDIEIKQSETKKIRINKNGKILFKFKTPKYFIWFFQEFLMEKMFIIPNTDLKEFFEKFGNRGIKFYKKYGNRLNILQHHE